IALYRHVSGARELRAIAGWLFTVTIRHCLRLAQWMAASASDRAADAALERLARRPEHELRLDLADAIQSLPPHYREVVLLRDVEEYRIDE
ncbi:sigma factor-like helix-turn-helix DNA-binding protein, partial [Acinetobacter baumannii]